MSLVFYILLLLYHSACDVIMMLLRQVGYIKNSCLCNDLQVQNRSELFDLTFLGGDTPSSAKGLRLTWCSRVIVGAPGDCCSGDYAMPGMGLGPPTYKMHSRSLSYSSPHPNSSLTNNYSFTHSVI